MTQKYATKRNHSYTIIITLTCTFCLQQQVDIHNVQCKEIKLGLVNLILFTYSGLTNSLPKVK